METNTQDIVQTERAILSKNSGSATRKRTSLPFNKIARFGLITYAYRSEKLGRALRVSGSVPIRVEDWLWLYQLPRAFHFRAVRLTTAFGKSNRNTQQKHHFMLTQVRREGKPFLNSSNLKGKRKAPFSFSSVKSELLKTYWD